MTLDELRTYLLALTPEEKAEVVQLLVQSLGDVWPGIEKTPGVVGGNGQSLPKIDATLFDFTNRTQVIQE